MGGLYAHAGVGIHSGAMRVTRDLPVAAAALAVAAAPLAAPASVGAVPLYDGGPSKAGGGAGREGHRSAGAGGGKGRRLVSAPRRVASPSPPASPQRQGSPPRRARGRRSPAPTQRTSPGMRQLMAHEPELDPAPESGSGSAGSPAPRPRRPHRHARQRGGSERSVPPHSYQSWRDPDLREAERRQLYGEAQPSEREWRTSDFQGRPRGRLRVGLFIAADKAGICAPFEVVCVMGEGNDRGFDEQFSPLRTKGYVEVDFKRDRVLAIATPTCDPSGGCNDAKRIGNGALGDYDNEVELSEHVMTVPAPQPGPPPPGVSVPTPEPVAENDTLVVSWELSNARLPGPFLAGPSIDGRLKLVPHADGSATVRLSGDTYPSWEVYYDDGCGATETLIREHETEISDLWPAAPGRSVSARLPPARISCPLTGPG
jgi:hypothetical protein